MRYILGLVCLVLGVGFSAQAQFNLDSNLNSDGKTWTFHTGEGYTIVEYPDPNGQGSIKIRSRCQLSAEDSGCLEKVYQFDRHEISQYVEMTANLFEARRNENLAYGILSSGIFIVSGKSFSKVFVGGALTPVTIGAGVSAVISGVFVALEAKNVYQYQSRLEDLRKFVTDSFDYANRCGHPRTNFLRRLEKKGVTLYFDENRAQLVSPEAFFRMNTLRQRMLGKIRETSRARKITRLKAYQQTFREACGQPNFVDGFGDWQGGPLRDASWKEIPEDIQSLAHRVSEVIQLNSKLGIIFKGFSEDHWDNVEIKKRVRLALLELAARVRWYERWGNKSDQIILKDFRQQFKSITIQRDGWGSKDYYELAENMFEKNLILKIRFSVPRWTYWTRVEHALEAALNSISPYE